MKNVIPLLLAAFLLASCEKDPDMEKLDKQYMVYTNYDKAVNFKSFDTFYLPDSLLVIGDKREAEYKVDASAQEIIQAYATQMEGRGYKRVTDRTKADLGLQVSYIKSTYFFTDHGSPEWWWNYPGYWDAPYWGNWGGWYYPYAVTYTYSTGSFLTEMVNLNAQQGADHKLPIVWTAYMTGLLGSSADVNTKLAVQGVQQTFRQSEYLKH